MSEPEPIFRRRYLPVAELKPGMILARRLISSVGGFLEEQLPAGCVLTETMLEKLSVSHADYACISEPETRTELELEARRRDEQARLSGIFARVDLADVRAQALFQALLDFRCSR